METKIQTLTVDRIEEGVVVAFSTDGQKYTFHLKELPLKENDIFKAEITKENNVTFLGILQKATEDKKSTLRSRLKKLFNK